MKYRTRLISTACTSFILKGRTHHSRHFCETAAAQADYLNAYCYCCYCGVDCYYSGYLTAGLAVAL